MHLFYYLFILFITFLPVKGNYDIFKPILNSKSSVDIDVGSNFTIKCEAMYELDWEIRRNYTVIEFPENINITHSYYSDREIYKHESILQIINARINDSGFYICINKNRLYSDSKAFVYVFVNDLENLFLPEFISKYPIVLYKNRTIPCLPSISTLNVTLWKGDEYVNLFEKRIEFDPMRGFIFNNPSSYFNGIFICKAIYKNHTQEISFNIIGKNLKPPVSNLGPVVNILMKSTLELNCTGESPLLWIKPNHSNPKAEENIIYKEYSDGENYVAELKIENVQYFHTGLYTCCYSGISTSTYCEPKDGVQVYVFVNDPDNLFINDKDHPVQSQYQCVRDAVYCLPTFSNLTVKLKKGNEYIPIGNNVSFDPRLGFLFYDPQPLSYLYTCIAENGSNTKEKKISSVTLEEKNDMYMYLSNSRPMEDDEIQIVCEVCNYNYKDIAWTWKNADGKNETVINKENHLGIKIIAESIIGRKRQILKFDSLKTYHSGIYQCIGLSKSGLSNGIKTGLLKVIALKKPFFIDTNMNGLRLFLHLGIHYDFRCFVEGIPLPNVSWYKDGKLIKEELPGIDLDENSQILRINPIIEEDYGKYSCKAENNLGFITGEVTINIQTGKQFTEFIEKNNLSSIEIFLISLFIILLIFLLSSIFILMKYICKLKKIDSEEEICIPEMIEIDEET